MIGMNLTGLIVPIDCLLESTKKWVGDLPPSLCLAHFSDNNANVATG